MKLRITLLVALVTLLLLPLTGCKRDFKEFSFSYSMESVSNYKVMVMFDSDKNYRLEKYNYYMDNFAKKRDPKIYDGKLSDEEFEVLKPILRDCGLFSMEDSYGFEEGSKSTDIVYQISFTADGREKFISIRGGSHKFPSSFYELIDFINEFLKTHHNE